MNGKKRTQKCISLLFSRIKRQIHIHTNRMTSHHIIFVIDFVWRNFYRPQTMSFECSLYERYLYCMLWKGNAIKPQKPNQQQTLSDTRIKVEYEQSRYTHTHTQTRRESEREREKKHIKTTINQSLLIFNYAHFHSTFQQTAKLCYTLFLVLCLPVHALFNVVAKKKS